MVEDDEMSEGFWKAVTKYGLGTAGFVVLMYVFIGEVRQDQKQLKHDHQSIIQTQAIGLSQTERTIKTNDQILHVMRMQCLNAAKNPDQRQNCMSQQ